jgi:hypothetical protein
MTYGYAAAFSPAVGRAFSRAEFLDTPFSEERAAFSACGSGPEDGPKAPRIDPEDAAPTPERFPS